MGSRLLSEESGGGANPPISLPIDPRPTLLLPVQCAYYQQILTGVIFNMQIISGALFEISGFLFICPIYLPLVSELISVSVRATFEFGDKK